jgi:hypothetical protein
MILNETSSFGFEMQATAETLFGMFVLSVPKYDDILPLLLNLG